MGLIICENCPLSLFQVTARSADRFTTINTQAYPWVQIDLGAEQLVKGVTVTGGLL